MAPPRIRGRHSGAVAAWPADSSTPAIRHDDLLRIKSTHHADPNGDLATLMVRRIDGARRTERTGRTRRRRPPQSEPQKRAETTMRTGGPIERLQFFVLRGLCGETPFVSVPPLLL
jgi:hypothetical protein